MNERRPTPDPDDDEPEMEIVPMAAPLRPTPRRRSGLAEEPIESGEITERRSLVIRTQPRVDVVVDPRTARAPSVEVDAQGTNPMPMGTPTDLPMHLPTPLPTPLPMYVAPFPMQTSMTTLPAAPTKWRGWIWLLAAVFVAGAGVATYAAKPTVSAINIDSLKATAALIGTTIDGEVRGVQVRAEAVATSSMLRAGIVTDAQTLADMARDKDMVFPVKDGETLEVFQIADGKRASLLRVPANGTELEPPPAGKSQLEARIGDVLAVIASAKVASPEPSISGEVALSAPIDLAPIRARLIDQVEEAVITGLAIPIVLVKSKGVTGNVVTLPVASSVADAKLSFSAIVRPPEASSLLPQIRLGVFGLAGLFGLLFLVSLLRR